MARSTSWRGSSTRFRRELPEDKLTFNVGLIGGGATAELDDGRIRLEATGKTNIIAGDRDRARRPARLSPEQIERAKAKMRAIVARPLPGATAKIEFDPDGYPPMAPTEGNRALLARLNVVNRDMGLAADGRARPGEARRRRHQLRRRRTSTAWSASAPASDGDHAPGETVDIASIWRQAKRAAILMSRLAKERR